MVWLAVLVSGEGLGFQAVHDACASGELDAAIVAFAAEKKCAAVHRAEAIRTPIIFHPWGPYKVAGKLRATYDRDLAVKLRMHRADYILLDGWERDLTWGFEEMYAGRILDLSGAASHPPETGEWLRCVDFVRTWLAIATRPADP